MDVNEQATTAYEGEEFDRLLHAWLSQFTGWLSPVSYSLAVHDWIANLSISPAKQLEIMHKAAKKFVQLGNFWTTHYLQDDGEICVKCREHDHRFTNDLWQKFPFNLYSQGFLLYEQLWDEISKGQRGVSKHHQNVVNFFGRQFLDLFSPSNYPWLNPEVLLKTYQESGMNYVRGFNNYITDLSRNFNNLPPAGTEHFQVGVDVAITKGKIVYRNQLIELIQYEPKVNKVFAEPILIVPAWIMKYYILDLSKQNSLVKYLVEKGHTVFMISWKNPGKDDRDLGMDDYVNLGIMDALKVINAIIPQKKVHAVGYCIGGTLLMIAAAAMGGNSDDRLKTITLFATQVDFKDAGEILLFVDESQVTFLEDVMWEKGYLDGKQMAGTFSMLRSIDLIWSRLVRQYLLGEPEQLNDLMAWDYDVTRLPYKMHTEYLRKCFLNNSLVQGQFEVADKQISLLDIKTPIFAVSTLTDHVAPWKSVYKLHLFVETDVSFVLTSGGHNAGIVSEPGHPNRNFQILTHQKDQPYMTSEEWVLTAQHNEGSWWPKWEQWLSNYSGVKIDPPEFGNPQKGYSVLCDAPGTYVLEK